MQETITRKTFGQAIRYELHIEENRQRDHYQIRVSCLQPALLEQLLGNSPALLKNQLLTIGKDAAYAFSEGIDFQEPLFISSTAQQVSLQARFSTR
ncbi:hypothetical protein Q0590_35245 [Rhodocytophaga aerolata]|uniref:Uncharacterized protein n=1 Tax=Rhodocytophaga aerolata TaxID=455078 RepID=A0ABT8RHK0_9BACT|nr:hypothetical protein [Rhodocytophaga aerolata]MDO1451582.1 hypothetical protein [Rhodocytophaga aerolata]